jgi:non-ribosomal peptide synthetase component F
VAEIFIALTAGGTLYMTDDDTLVPGPALVRFLNEHRITHAKFTPSALAALPDDDLPSVRTLVVGGEACPAELVTRWAPGREFFNVYGPTEATVRSTVGSACPTGARPLLEGRSPTRAPTCWTRPCSRCRSACRASCTWAAWGWRAATRGAPA